VVIVPPEGGLEFSAGLTKKIVFIHVTVENSLEFTLQDCNRLMEHTRFLLYTNLKTDLGNLNTKS